MRYAIPCMNGPRSSGPSADHRLSLVTGPSRPLRLARHGLHSGSHAVHSGRDRFGILCLRTTRSVSLLEAGARFIGGVEPALTVWRDSRRVDAERGEVTGLLRITTVRGALGRR